MQQSNIAFALTGAAGYIAPRHMKAISETGNSLVAALDPHDAVGVMDSYFPACKFFTEFERFDRHLEKLRRIDEEPSVKYLSICSPNYLHDAHIRTALRVGADAICEKPLVLNPWNIDALEDLQAETGQQVYNVLQLRVHPTIVALKKRFENTDQVHDIDLSYITSRGAWYLISWKGNVTRSGGLVSNIGIHFFDMLSWIFGRVEKVELHESSDTTTAGYLQLEKARVRWFLSVDAATLPQSCKDAGQKTFRSITIDGEEVEFSSGFADLHTVVYQDILNGGGYGLSDARPSIELCHRLRTSDIAVSSKNKHSFLKS